MLRLQKNIWLCIQAASLYIGAIIGAGFASGQEILQFFVAYGWLGLWGIVLATILFAYLGGLVLLLAVRYQTTGYQDLLPKILGKYGSKLLDILSQIMLVGSLGIMFAGSGAVFKEYLGLWPGIGIMLAVIVTIIVILGGLKRVLVANVVLVPLKMLAVIVISILAIINHGGLNYNLSNPGHINNISSNWFVASILYVSYNIPIAVLSSLGRNINMKTAVISGILGGTVLGLTAGLIALAELCYYPNVTNYQIPLLHIANEMGPHFHYFYGILVWLAIITTAIANVHGFTSRFAPQNSTKYKIIGIGVCLIVLPLTKFKFGQLVQVIYPLFGYGGLAILLSLVFFPVLQLFKRYR